MSYLDLREYVKDLEGIGELKRIQCEVDWKLEAAAICAMRNKLGGPSLLFENVRDYPGKRLAGEIYGGSKERPWSHIALALGLAPSISYEEFVEVLSDRYESPLKPVIVDSGPCKENIKIGEDANILDFPIPYIHDGDGGRYSTCHCQINRDPDTGWTNWGMYRWMVYTKNRLGGMFQPGQHLAEVFYHKFEAKDKPMPFAIALGGSPSIFIAATCDIPVGVDEADYAGGFNLAPIEVAKCETNDLYVPAHAEVVIEGYMPPHERWDEGPFGEFFGFMYGPSTPQPVYKIEAITYRNEPLIPMVVEGCPVNSSQAVATSILGWKLTYQLKRGQKWPVKAVFMPTQAPWACAVVSTEVPYSGFVKVVANFLFAQKQLRWSDTVIVVDSDTDPSNIDSVFHDIVFKVNKDSGIIKYPSEPAGYIFWTSYRPPEERRTGKTTKLLIDATTPKEWAEEERPPKLGFEHFPKEVQDKVLGRWKEDYKLGEEPMAGKP